MKVMLVLGIILLVFPFLLIIVLLCCRTKPPEDDPTLIKPLSGEERERRDKIISKRKARRAKRSKRAARRQSQEPERTESFASSSTLSAIDLDQPLLGTLVSDQRPDAGGEAGNEYRSPTPPDAEDGPADDEVELEDLEEYRWEFIFKEDKISVSSKDLSSMDEFKNTAQLTLTVNQRRLSYAITMMYKMLDCVLDGSTIDRILSTLRAALIIGCIGLGWYVGAVLGQDEVEKFYDDYDCGAIAS
jgi:hypothetical protein